ncbi:protein kinase domain protein [Ophiocordyceps sinensis CO18]|uniref:non-specific serine/threonine protein kinase n=1 Tax=Ophiocordyceps sinensis (strain Co18 / CGMCC 3.14243) TaxID=911162 RepID=T5AH99_OPHSC|nr:protein kinase domain protein [Ophiocordyceps sinensis CO18]
MAWYTNLAMAITQRLGWLRGSIFKHMLPSKWAYRTQTTPTMSHGKPLLPAPLDRFSIHGPNGTHFCLVTNPAGCSLSNAKGGPWGRGLFQLHIARALAAQLAVAVEQIHDKKFIHGDLHLANVLLHLPSGLDHLSEEQLYNKFGAPEAKAVIRLDGKPIPPNVPSHAIRPIRLSKPSKDIVLSDAKVLLVDFGAAFRPLEESSLHFYTPREVGPPEARFEPTTGPSFASDIWTLACTIFAILGRRSLFNGTISFQYDIRDEMTTQQVDALGCLPPEW